MNIMFFLKPKSELAYIYDYHTLRQALEIMEHHRYSSVPIISKDGEYIGTITEGDLLWYLKSSNILSIKDAEDIPILSLDRKSSYDSVNGNSDMESLIMKALNQNFVPVTDDMNNFIGIITRKDIILYYYNRMEEEDKE
ncbi:CBS domain-containing protein [Aequitasia blattaphilus]|uniref:CBS domain-containing protein n=1 Tax=Aequitasia blattaphilus TaxID=2949332 RepID=A0ABT1E5E6_9FIRM|nr:CBS domain-containing protein [Aequitasia blattaphilus]MCP1101074.1 CBS domain-containing protein [Aequitasia blattaphilus]MCR8613714.1 CBS domain-containing protein [Aequitasia blattaphilus]